MEMRQRRQMISFEYSPENSRLKNRNYSGIMCDRVEQDKRLQEEKENGHSD